jgi:hypothetical protein
LKKLGLLYEKQGDYSSAVKAYTQLKKDYAKSQDGFNIDKFIYRAEAAVN